MPTRGPVPTGRLTRAQQREVTRARLLEAGAAVFADRGYHAASVEEVAERAGFSKGAVYSNFASKEDLFLAVLEHRMTLHLRGYHEVFDAEAGPGIDEAGAHLDELLDGGGRPWLMLMMEFWLHAMRNPDARYKLAARNRVLREAVGTLIERHVTAAGADLEGRSGDAAAVVLALSHGLALQRLVDPTGVPDDLFRRALTTMFESLAPGETTT